MTSIVKMGIPEPMKNRMLLRSPTVWASRTRLLSQSPARFYSTQGGDSEDDDNGGKKIWRDFQALATSNATLRHPERVPLKTKHARSTSTASSSSNNHDDSKGEYSENKVKHKGMFFDAEERFHDMPDLQPNPDAKSIAEQANELQKRLVRYQRSLYEERRRARFHTLFVSAARMQRYHEVSLRAKEEVRQTQPGLEQSDELEFLSQVKFRVLDQYTEIFDDVRKKIVHDELDPKRKLRYEDDVNAFLNRVKGL